VCVHIGHMCVANNKGLLYFRHCAKKTCSQSAMLLRVDICNSFVLCCNALIVVCCDPLFVLIFTICLGAFAGAICQCCSQVPVLQSNHCRLF
jgi:hypothetical protein